MRVVDQEENPENLRVRQLIIQISQIFDEQDDMEDPQIVIGWVMAHLVEMQRLQFEKIGIEDYDEIFLKWREAVRLYVRNWELGC